MSSGNTHTSIDRVILIVMDSVGCGELPDAAKYGDSGANTIAHVADAVGGAELPVLQSLGFGNLTPIDGVPGTHKALGAYGKCAEISAGKDTATGHWEMAGLKIDTPFVTFPDGFPDEIIEPFCERTGRGVLGNKAASGTEIIKELGEEHIRTGKLIVYTSADSVFQIAAHEDVVPLEELYRCCEIARDILDDFGVARVIARPFIGPDPSSYERTYNRRDYAVPPPRDTVLDFVAGDGLPVVGVGKIHDIYAGHGVTEKVKSKGNHDGMAKTMEAMARVDKGLIFTNLVDFDAKYGHRRNPAGYYDCLREFDADLGELMKHVRRGRDLLVLTADHGNDPTMPGTDHTREYIPLLVYGPESAAGIDLGIRGAFADIGATIADVFDLEAPPYGESFLPVLAGAEG
jgi:phosphopentomutase